MVLVLTAIMMIVIMPLSTVAGTNGILEGIVKDKTSGEPIPGVNVALAELQRGTVTDAGGRFVLQNIRAGRYDVRFSHIGHRAHLLKNVIINPDLRTRLTIELEPTDVELNEITVTQEKPLIQKDITGTTFIVSGEDAMLLPIDNVVDVVRLKAGVTLEGNIRGGKTSEVLYLVDGLPVQDVMGGGISATLPNSSITGLSIYTGGFEPEYGNALSGIVNIVTKTGTNEHRAFARASSDNLFGVRQTSKTNEFEASLSGPIFQNTLYYFGAVNGFLTGTRWWQDFQGVVNTPIDKTISGFAKLEYLFTPTTHLAAQVLYSDHDWRDYEYNWRFDLSGLPPERRTANRIAAIFSQSLSDWFFYTASISRFFYKSKISNLTKDEVAALAPYQYDFLLRYIVSGNRSWRMMNSQESYSGKIDATLKAGDEHLIKFGGELSLYNLNADVIKFEPRKTYFGKPLISEPQLNFSSAYNYRPRSGAVYIQDKIDLSTEEGIMVNVGLRWDFLDPRAQRPAIEAIPVSDSAYTFNVAKMVNAGIKQQISPRFGASMQVSEKSYLFINIGWYFQYPLFDYLYTGLDRVALAKGISAVTGNPDLEPERTQAFEVSYRHILPLELVGSVTYFKKETRNLVDAKTFIPGDSKLAGNFGFAEYVNNPFAEASGIELTLTRERGRWVTGELSYTYMLTEGTSESAQDGFYIAQYGLPPAVRTFPLSWDQRHSAKLLVNIVTPWDLNLFVLSEYHTGRPYTNYPTATGWEPVKGGLFSQNNARMPSYFNADVRIEKILRFDWWSNATVKLFLDIRNVSNDKNVRWVDSNGKVGGELEDPSGYYIGRRTRLGIQAEF